MRVLRKTVHIAFLMAIGFFLLNLTVREEEDANFPQRYQFELTPHTPRLHEPADNLTTYEGVALGKKLFFDTILSKNHKVSCASCHNPNQLFGDTLAFSIGLNGNPTTKNSMPLINLGWKNKFFWDGRVGTLEEVMKFPIEHPEEMGLPMDSAVARLNANSDYREMFKVAFPGQKLDATTLSKALAQYLRTLTYFNSRLDSLYEDYASKGEYVDGQHAERLGLRQHTIDVLMLCERCHGTVTYGGLTFTNNGLPSNNDGIGDESQIFVAPTLRNIGLTGPYMHDGRFKTLDEVIDHYSNNITLNDNLDTLLMKDGKPITITLDSVEKAQLKYFLTYYLTDIKL